MILLRDAFWNLLTGVSLLLVLMYAYVLHTAFKGGAIRRAYSYLLVALVVMCASFLAKVPLDLLGIEDPLAAYGVTYANFGVLIGAVLLLISMRELARVWRNIGSAT